VTRPPVRRDDRDQNTVRIIAGRWRGRRVRFPDGQGLRPTPARLRETLFNWLAADLRDARVLDAFAGSGALALEALSRGAASAVLVDASATVCSNLRRQIDSLGGEPRPAATVVQADALRWLATQPATPFDLVFLDPPFHAGLLAPAMHALARGWLRSGSLVYCEGETAPPEVPVGWRLHRQQQGGQSTGLLFVIDAASA
jgi:16S rRNA (guanine966-N2)-methyltransferase